MYKLLCSYKTDDGLVKAINGISFSLGKKNAWTLLVKLVREILHPYTEGLFDSLTNLKKRGEELVPIKGMMPDPTNVLQGCAFSPRCPYASEACSQKIPEMRLVKNTYYVACDAYNNPNFQLRGAK